MAEPERSEDLLPSYRATINLRFPVGSGGGTNTFHFRTGVDALPDDDIAPILGWLEDFYTAAAPLFPSSWYASWDGSLTEILTSEPVYRSAGTGWEVRGTNSDGGYSGAASMACVTWRSSLNTRSGRGRTFLGPLAPGSIQLDGTLDTNELQTLRTAANSLVSQSNTNDNVGAFGVFSPTDSLLRDIVAASVTDQVAVLRSRRG